MKLKISMILLTMLGLSLTMSSFRAAAEFGLDTGPLYTDSTECDLNDEDTELGCITGPDDENLPQDSYDPPSFADPDREYNLGTASCAATVNSVSETGTVILRNGPGLTCPGKPGFNQMKQDLIEGLNESLQCNQVNDVLRLYYPMASGATAHRPTKGKCFRQRTMLFSIP